MPSIVDAPYQCFGIVQLKWLWKKADGDYRIIRQPLKGGDVAHLQQFYAEALCLEGADQLEH